MYARPRQSIFSDAASAESADRSNRLMALRQGVARARAKIARLDKAIAVLEGRPKWYHSWPSGSELRSERAEAYEWLARALSEIAELTESP